MRRTTLVAPGNRKIQLLVPETEAERAHGMNSDVPPPFDGMVFNFDPAQTWPTMTMDDTPMALQIAFIGPDYIVHTIRHAAPHSGFHSTPKLTRWVIETHGGWSVLRVGDRVGFEAT